MSAIPTGTRDVVQSSIEKPQGEEIGLQRGQLVALCVLALLTLGVLMVNSARMSVDPTEAVTAKSIIFSRSSAYMVSALAAMGIVALLPIRRLVPRILRTSSDPSPEHDSPPPRISDVGLRTWMRHLPGGIRETARQWLRLSPMWAITAAMLAFLSLVYVPGLGRAVNGSHRWVSLPVPGLESFQPSEAAKWGMIVVLGWYGARFAGRMGKFWTGLMPGLGASGLVAGFIVMEDLGTGVLIAVVSATMLIAAGGRVWQLLSLAPFPLAGLVLAIATSDYRRDRLLAFLDPYEQPQTIGYHMIQSMTAVSNGEVAGRGLGHGLQKFGYLPEDHTDFLFAIVCEELGVMGCLIVVSLYAVLLWTCASIVRRERWLICKLIGLGVLTTIGVQAVINLFVVTGLGPTKGIALPLLSSGGTGWILTAASLGLLIAMDKTARFAHTCEPAHLVRSALPAPPTPHALPTREVETVSQTPINTAIHTGINAGIEAGRQRVQVGGETFDSRVTILSSPGVQHWHITGSTG